MRLGRSPARWREASGVSLIGDGEKFAELAPVERGAGVGLASRRDIGVPYDVDDGVTAAQNQEKLAQGSVLRVRIRPIIDAFELDADGKVVAALASAPDGSARVPGALGA